MARYYAIKIDGVRSVLVKSEFRGATINVQECTLGEFLFGRVLNIQNWFGIGLCTIVHVGLYR